MSGTDYKFEGWGAFAPDSIEGNFKKFEYTPKKWEETDVDSTFCFPLAATQRRV
jgi:hypothetical protein